VLNKRLKGLRVDVRNRYFYVYLQLVHEVLNEQWDVVTAFSQRWHF
jgi:hypothetical protein